MKLDVQTLVFVLGITYLIQIAVLFQQYSAKKAYPGTGWWLLWSTSTFFGIVFMLLRQIPSIETVSIILQNTLLLSGAVLLYVGILRFFEKKENIRMIVFSMTVFLTVFLFYLFVNNDLHRRGILISGALAMVSFFTVQTLLANRSDKYTFSVNFLAAVFLVHGCVFTFRTIVMYAGIRIEDIFLPTVINYLPFLDGIIAGILWTFGLIMMINQRLTVETSEATLKFELIFNTGPDAVLISTFDDGKILNVNSSFITLTGYTREELIGRSTLDIKLWVDPSEREKVVNSIRTHDGYDNIEAEFQRKNGSRLFGLLSASMVTLDHVPCILSVIRDISNRKSMEEALKESNDRFSKVFQTSPFVITITHAEDGRFIDVNEAFTTITGYQREEALADSSIGLKLWVNEEDLQHVTNELRAGKTVNSQEYRFRTRSGKIITAMFSAQLIQLSCGMCILSSINDISERKQAEEDKNRILNSSQDLICVVDMNGLFKYVNPAWEKILGYTREELLSRPFSDLSHPDDGEKHNTEVDKLTQGVDSVGFENRYKHKDGSVRDIAWTATLQFETNEMYCIGRDVTVQKRLENKQATLQARLHQAQKLEAIGQLASGIAHDFNNILGGISGYADLLKLKYRNDPETSDYVRKIAVSTGSASHLTRQLMTFARNAKVENRLFDVHASLTAAIELLERTIDKSIRITKKFSSSTPILFSDQNLFESCLLNLGINARDAMPHGGILTIATDFKDIGEQPDTEGKFKWKTGRYIIITVTDTGTGMDESVKQRIFEPFFTTKELGKGTGLGLASVYGFVRQNDGYITVDSMPGKGTCFTLYFPVTHHEPAPQAPAADEQIRRYSGSGTILIAEDNADISETLFVQLEQIGYRPILCNNGLEAIRYFREHHHDIAVVILDVIMPVMNGLECLREMKLVDPNVKVIVCSGYSGGKSREMVLREGILAFLEKPFRFKDIARYLQKALHADSALATALNVRVPASESR